MKPFNIKFDGTRAVIATCIECEGNLYKKTLTAYDGEELWNGMKALARLDGLPKALKLEAVEFISKQKERELISIALPKFLESGGKIKECPSAGHKMTLTKQEQEDILEVMGNLEVFNESSL